MPVMLEYISVIIPREVLEEKYPPGFRSFRSSFGGRVFCCDRYIARVSFMGPQGVDWFIEEMSRWGLVYIEDGKCVDMAVEQGAPKEGQKEGQQPAVLPRRGAQPELAAHKKTPVLQGFAAGCEVVQSGRVEDRGLEPYAFTCGNRVFLRQGGAKSGAVDRNNSTADFGLGRVIETWSSLPPDIRTAILTIVAAAAPSAPWLPSRVGEGGEISTVPP